MPSSRIIKQPASFQTYNWGAPGQTLKPPQVIPSAPLETQNADGEQLRQASQKGYAEGEAASRRIFEESANALHAELARSIADLAQTRSVIYKDARADLLRLSIAIARRIVHRELLVSPDILESIVSVVLEKLDRQEVQRVRVHPTMAARLDQDLKNLPHQRPIQVTGDATLPPGACIFETGRGNVDASIDSQLGEIERGLADRLEA
jgi:flagellar assembly protein FliH